MLQHDKHTMESQVLDNDFETMIYISETDLNS